MLRYIHAESSHLSASSSRGMYITGKKQAWVKHSRAWLTLRRLTVEQRMGRCKAQRDSGLQLGHQNNQWPGISALPGHPRAKLSLSSLSKELMWSSETPHGVLVMYFPRFISKETGLSWHSRGLFMKAQTSLQPHPSFYTSTANTGEVRVQKKHN